MSEQTGARRADQRPAGGLYLRRTLGRHRRHGSLPRLRHRGVPGRGAREGGHRVRCDRARRDSGRAERARGLHRRRVQLAQALGGDADDGGQRVDHGRRGGGRAAHAEQRDDPGSATSPSWPSTGARTGPSCRAWCGCSSWTWTTRAPGLSRPARWWSRSRGEEMRRQIREPGCAEAMRVAQETFHAEGSGRSSRPVPPAPNPRARTRPTSRTAPDPVARPSPSCPTALASHRAATANRLPTPSARSASPSA